MSFSTDDVVVLLSPGRFAPYLRHSGDDPDDALLLYEWSASMSMAMFELFSHLEVMIRNSIDRTLAQHFKDEAVGIPWFLRKPPASAAMAGLIETERSRLRPNGKDTRHQIVAAMSFGFWTQMTGNKYDDLWRTALFKAFPGSSGRRADVSRELEALRKLRNRIAHHDSMLNVDVPFEVRRMHRVASFLGTAAVEWIESVDRTDAVYRARPHSVIDTLVVPANDAWPLYQMVQAYVCQPNRAFQETERLAFYADRAIQPEVPKIRHRRDNVTWTDHEAARLAQSNDKNDRKIASVIQTSRAQGWKQSGEYQVFLLSGPGAQDHRTLPAAIPNRSKGLGSAFVRKQRYVSLHRLQTATSTDDVI
ncbi:hypothetical protein GII33_13935 [Gordonia pseudamarae]|jgi:hypothetical protein|uniref:Abi-like protein n=1 Tax=Gordonia pseudamarae TaxID=2831662 RepID=A0ABX6IJ86_9ACTN|nr:MULTISPECIES: hypothetical protein [Gordonia]MBD0022542.1 hypothetical protein [Gordonia sp. (in: high G+C Gram-positive bacteria)]QHN26887.1 hypothetical protein GII33_13935 [Gordonia pseudamarae]QHN35777.1 hypothetical protein GII31_13760 [Gordonia pseudamarae]